MNILVVVAHPDDADFGAAGTLAVWASQGARITLVVVTRGEQGAGRDEDMTTIALRREAEQRAASATLGVSQVHFLEGFRDGWVTPSNELVREIVRWIRRVRPDRILTQSPERDWTRIFASHPDHLAVGEAVLRAAYPAAENPHAWPELVSGEGLADYKVPEVWLMAHPSSNVAVDISETIGQKVAALHEHASQVAPIRGELEGRLRSWAAQAAAANGLEGRLAEAFFQVWINRP